MSEKSSPESCLDTRPGTISLFYFSAQGAVPSAFPLRLMGRALTARWDPQEGTVPSTLLGARSFPQAPGLSAPRAVRTKRSATHRPVGGILSQAKSVHAGSSGSKTVVFVVRSGLLLLDFPDFICPVLRNSCSLRPSWPVPESHVGVESYYYF